MEGPLPHFVRNAQSCLILEARSGLIRIQLKICCKAHAGSGLGLLQWGWFCFTPKIRLEQLKSTAGPGPT